MPPCWAGASRHILGTVAVVTSPRFIIGPAARRTRSTSSHTSRLALDSRGLFVAGETDLFGLQAYDGHAVVDARHANPFDARRRRGPWAGAHRTIEPATSRNSMGMGAWAPGTPSMCVVAVVADAATRRLHGGDREAVRVLHPDPNLRRVAGRG